jgi:hypothetical protein
LKKKNLPNNLSKKEHSIEAFAELPELSQAIARLADAKKKPQQQSLLQKSGEIFSKLIVPDIPVSGTETTFEINIGVMKFRYTVKKEKNKESTATDTGGK